MSATVMFAIRGTSKTPYFTGGRSTYAAIGSNSLDSGAATGVISNSVINLDQSSAGQHALVYDGYGNLGTSNKMSVLIRVAFADTGSARQLFSIVGPALVGRVSMRYTGTQLRVDVGDEVTGSTINFGTVNWTPTAATYYDICLVLDCSTTTSGLSINVYVDGSSVLAPNNASGTWSNPTNPNIKQILLGTDQPTTLITTRIKINEFVIWDGLCDPTSGGLNLNGSSRSSFVTATAFTADTYTDPGIANVKTGTAYTQAGVALTGTYDGSDRWTDPGQANVRSGTAYKANSTSNNKTGTMIAAAAATTKTGVTADDGTGTYDGSDRWTDPGIANVRSSTAYKANSTSNNRTGTAAIPTAANVRAGTATDATTGTLAVPSAGNVRSGVSVDAGTGTLVVPSLADTKTGVAGDGGTGTYDGSDRWTELDEADVRSGTAYKANSTSNNRTGTIVIPADTDVRDGVTVDHSSGSCLVPDPADVRAGVDIDATVGTLDLPAESDVKHDVDFDGGNQTGTYRGLDLWDASAPEELANGVTKNQNGTPVAGIYMGEGDNDEIDIEDVKHGVTYLNFGVSKVGTYRGLDLWDPFIAGQIAVGEQGKQNGVNVVGTFVGELAPTTVRQVLNVILKFIGEPTLTDVEYDALTIDENSPAQDVYAALDAVLIARDSVSSSREKLSHYFLAKGVVLVPIVEPTERVGTVLIGAELGTPETVPDGYESNVYIGGEL